MLYQTDYFFNSVCLYIACIHQQFVQQFYELLRKKVKNSFGLELSTWLNLDDSLMDQNQRFLVKIYNFNIIISNK